MRGIDEIIYLIVLFISLLWFLLNILGYGIFTPYPTTIEEGAGFFSPLGLVLTSGFIFLCLFMIYFNYGDSIWE